MKTLLAKGATHAVLTLWTVFSIVPFVLIALLSLRDNLSMSAHPFGVGGTYHFGNYSQAYHGPYGSAGMSVFLLNSLKGAIAALIVNLSAGAPAAYFATGLRPAAQTRLMRFFLLGTIVPFVLLLIPYYREYQALNLLDSPTAAGVAYGVIGLPTTILILYSYFRTFPAELREAAAIDGLGSGRTFLQIVLPLSRGAVAAAGLLEIIWVWNETQLAIVLLQQPGSLTVPVGLLGFQQTFTTDYGPLFAGLSIALLPVLVLYLAFSKSIIRGVSLGGSTR
jgi:ABC-type glycerol-3-phosphate transport system permease component